VALQTNVTAARAKTGKTSFDPMTRVAAIARTVMRIELQIAAWLAGGS
jgi:hypothetical protein